MARGARRVHGKGVKVQGQEQSKGSFSKRCRAIINQADELCICTGAHIALIILSSHGVYSFGFPNVQFVIDKFLNQRDRDLSSDDAGGDDRAVVDDQSPQNNMKSLIRKLLLLQEELEKEKKHGEMLDQRIEDYKGKYWWAKPIETLDLNQLKELVKINRAIHDDIAKVLGKAINEVPSVIMDLPQDATIPYIIDRFSLTNGEGSSSVLTHDSEKLGVDADSALQGEGSSRSSNTDASKMKPRIDG